MPALKAKPETRGALRIAICWTLSSGYMAACWRALAAMPGIELQALFWKASSDDNIAFDDTPFSDLRCVVLDRGQRDEKSYLLGKLEEFDPDVLIVSGWNHQPYLHCANRLSRGRAKVIMTMDNSLMHTWKQTFGRWLKPWLLRNVDALFVAGERAYALAKFVGFHESQIHLGCYGFDIELFSRCQAERDRRHPQWPRNFLFIGRYVERKAIDVLIQSFQRYRSLVPDPWTLTCCGQGPLGHLLEGKPSVVDRGFMQPNQLPDCIENAGAFVLPSRFEAWGVALAEAAASGLPLIASQSVGATAELLRDGFNGRLVATGSVEELTAAMLWTHEQEGRLAEIGNLSRAFAAPYGDFQWAQRVIRMIRCLLPDHPFFQSASIRRAAP